MSSLVSILRNLLGSLALAACAAVADDAVVLSDETVSVSETEFRAILESLPRGIVEKAAAAAGDRFELINQLMITRKLAAEAAALTPADPGYWPLQFKVMEVRKDMRFRQLVEQAAEADEEELLALARERYATLKDRYAKVPETRASSHILLSATPGLDRSELRERAQRLLQELRAGADFGDYVERYSEDPGSKRRGGSLGRWVRFGEKNITPPYSEALFDIEEVGGYSEVTDSPFGLHIIRLDGVRPARYRDFEEVKDDILESIMRERRQLAVREVRARYLLGDDAFIDGPAMERLFAPYR